MPWDPDLYERFRAQRYAPFEDLARLLRVREGLRAVDLGCGTGELTERLAALLPSGDVLGLDTSSAMLARARDRARPGLAFREGRLEELGGEWDLVFSHAAIHWADGHDALIPRLLSRVAPGGQLLLQFPSNHGHPVYGIAREVLAEEPFRSDLGGWSRPSPVLPLEAYGEILHRCGARDFTLVEKVYPHLLQDAEALVSWILGTTLVPAVERIQEPHRAAFRHALLERISDRWPGSPVYFGFKRILLAADRPLAS